MKPDDFKVLIVGDRVWGRGDTIAEALTNVRKNDRRCRQYIVYIATADTYLDEAGNMCFPHGCYPKEINRVGFSIRKPVKKSRR